MYEPQTGQAATGSLSRGSNPSIDSCGLSSAVKELFDAVSANCGLSERLLGSLGLGVADQGNQSKETTERPMADAIRAATYRLRASSERLDSAITHINS